MGKKIPKKLVTKTLDYIKSSAKENGVTVKISKYKNVRLNNFLCSGYFMYERTPPLLAFATGKPTKDWIGVAIHESCHMDQWIEQCPVWTNSIMTDYGEPMNIIEKWIDGREIEDSFLRKNIYNALDIELDCEKRSVEKMKMLGLDEYIDPVEYTQKSNSYVLFYLALYRTRQWYKPHKKPYDLEAVWSKMPKTWRVDYRDHHQKYVNLIIKECLDNY